MNFTVSRGMVSYVGRRIDGNYYLQSDLATNDGNSGGPVVNDRGEVIAVMTFILRDSQGLAFAVPSAWSASPPPAPPGSTAPVPSTTWRSCGAV